MKNVEAQLLNHLEKDLKDWEDAAAFFEKIRTVTTDGQIYSWKDFAERYRARAREPMQLRSKVMSELRES